MDLDKRYSIKKKIVDAEYLSGMALDEYSVKYCKYLLKIFDSPWGDPFLKDMFKTTKETCNNGKSFFNLFLFCFNLSKRKVLFW